jgi:hypothetical protein
LLNGAVGNGSVMKDNRIVYFGTIAALAVLGLVVGLLV